MEKSLNKDISTRVRHVRPNSYTGPVYTCDFQMIRNIILAVLSGLIKGAVMS